MCRGLLLSALLCVGLLAGCGSEPVTQSGESQQTWQRYDVLKRKIRELKQSTLKADKLAEINKISAQFALVQLDTTKQSFANHQLDEATIASMNVQMDEIEKALQAFEKK